MLQKKIFEDCKHRFQSLNLLFIYENDTLSSHETQFHHKSIPKQNLDLFLSFNIWFLSILMNPLWMPNLNIQNLLQQNQELSNFHHDIHLTSLSSYLNLQIKWFQPNHTIFFHSLPPCMKIYNFHLFWLDRLEHHI